MSAVFERLLAARGVGQTFLRPKYEECLGADLLPDMEKAVERTKRAVKNGEKVLIYGDYDADGVTASTVMYDTLKLAGITEIEVMLPNRFTDGYGMSKKCVQKAKENRVNLVFTVDCGSRNNEVIEALTEAGIDTIVTDHHECGANLPDAVAVVNPKRKDVTVKPELKELAGVGVAFKFAQALTEVGLIPEGQEKWLLDLVVIGTICDSMVLRGENRRLCVYGVKVLEKTRRPGVKELMKLARVNEIGGGAIGFQIGPRLNAAGRMDSAEWALKLLMTNSRTEAVSLAEKLEELNKARKEQQEAAIQEIVKRGVMPGPVIIEEGDWHEGVLGIIAGRLTEEYRKPAFVLAKKEGILKGSGRSFGEFSLAETLTACGNYIIGGGGHAEACGVKLEAEKLGAFRRAVATYYESLKLENQERFLAVREDVTVEELGELTLETMAEIRALEPFGAGNEEPVFLLQDVQVTQMMRLGAEGQHLKMQVKGRDGKDLKLMCFCAPEGYFEVRPGETVNVWVHLTENEFRGLKSIEGRIVKLTK